MGGKGSGPTTRYNINMYKIYGMRDIDNSNYWYISVSKHVPARIKATLIYQSKHGITTKIHELIKSKGYNFKVEQIEELQEGLTYREARLYAQEKYILNKPVENQVIYCFCPKENTNEKNIIEQKVIELYNKGYKIWVIQKELNLKYSQVRHYIKKNNLNKMATYNKALEEYNNGASIWDLQLKYFLSDYMMDKIMAKGNKKESNEAIDETE